MDKDQVKGRVEEAKGKVKEAKGKVKEAGDVMLGGKGNRRYPLRLNLSKQHYGEQRHLTHSARFFYLYEFYRL